MIFVALCRNRTASGVPVGACRSRSTVVLLSARKPLPVSATGETPDAAPIERRESIAGIVVKRLDSSLETTVVRVDAMPRTELSALSDAESSSTSSDVRSKLFGIATRTVTIPLDPGASVIADGIVSTRVPRLVEPISETTGRSALLYGWARRESAIRSARPRSPSLARRSFSSTLDRAARSFTRTAIESETVKPAAARDPFTA